MEFTEEGAICAQTIIDESLNQARNCVIASLQSKNRDRFEYWWPRLLHLMRESIWIEEIIREMEAAADERKQTA